MVFYFTATGNSLYVARAMEPEPISIPQIIHQSDLAFSDSAIGIVYPNFGSSQPPMVQEFLSHARFETRYFYILVTYGRRIGLSAKAAQELCTQSGISLAYFNSILMVDNYLPKFDMLEEMRLNKHVDEQLAAISSDIVNRVRYLPAISQEELEAHKKLEQKKIVKKLPDHTDYAHGGLLSVTDSCIGCGICARVCPNGDYRVEDARAVHTFGFCQQCLACVHHCPAKAIHLTVPEKNPNARYRNLHVSLEDIIKSNHQI